MKHDFSSFFFCNMGKRIKLFAAEGDWPGNSTDPGPMWLATQGTERTRILGDLQKLCWETPAGTLSEMHKDIPCTAILEV